MPWTQQDLSFKYLLNKRESSSGKAFYEEFGDDTLNTHMGNVWIETIADNDPAQAVIDGVAELRTSFVLTEDTSVPNQQCYYAYDSVRLRDWISDKYGATYAIHLYQNNGTEIFPTDACQWLFSYQTGILIFNGSTAAFAKPFKITGYRYIGTKGLAGIPVGARDYKALLALLVVHKGRQVYRVLRELKVIQVPRVKQVSKVPVLLAF